MAAYIQSALSSGSYGELCLSAEGVSIDEFLIAKRYENVSPLGATMAFLYSTYIVLNAVLSSLLGKVIDKDWTANKTLESSFTHVGGYVRVALREACY